ncbi:hypothetical protein RUM44_011555 [Polyplax serrata]|uniref:Uncharacterized protein n=1 Tax=Polyplax serrata TaxID=468196 RepID=A0ABR1AQC6_POLSC
MGEARQFPRGLHRGKKKKFERAGTRRESEKSPNISGMLQINRVSHGDFAFISSQAHTSADKYQKPRPNEPRSSNEANWTNLVRSPEKTESVRLPRRPRLR